jgi:integrase
MKLTTQKISQLAPPPGKGDALFWDDAIPGFGVRARASGRRLWIFQYRLGLRQRRMTIGLVSAVSVGDARKVAAQLYAKTKLGLDPAGERIEHQVRAAETFGAAVELYLARRKTRLRPLSYGAVARHLHVNAKSLHRLPLVKIDRRTIATLLAKVATSVSDATTNRVRTSLSGFFAWAMREGLVETNPVLGTEQREEKSRDRVLTDAEIAEIWAALQDDTYGAIVRLLILTGARRAEIGALRWDEVDFESGLISLPAARTKNGRPHVIALNLPATEVLRARPSDREFVLGRGWNGFHSWANSKIALDERILEARRAAADLADSDPDKIVPMPAWVLHDFRRYLSTTMHERLGIPPHIIESILGHVGHQGGRPGVYNKSLYIAEKANALSRWADHVTAIVEGHPPKVVPMSRA